MLSGTTEEPATQHHHLTRSFDEMPLNQRLLRGIYSYGFEEPSPIQQAAVVPFIRGGDIIAQAQSGTGKTGAFSIGILQRLDFRQRCPQALVLSPTRELVQQTHGVLCGLGDYLSDEPYCAMFVGKTNITEDLRRLRTGSVLVAVGTPGRLGDLVRRGALRTDSIRTVVLDEADEMLSEGFTEQVCDIFKYLPKNVQVALFSATMPVDVLNLSERFMRTPTKILVDRTMLTLKGIRQFYIALEESDKTMALMDLYETVSIAQSVIFVSSRRKVDHLASVLNGHNHTVAALHAEMSRDERQQVMDTFRSGTSRVLVTTDLVARGIDVQHVNIVINYDVPTSKESYLHRIGRSGRYGRKGIAINFVTPCDMDWKDGIEAHYKTTIQVLPMDFVQYLGEEDRPS